ncbi:MAG: hypothetical protein CL678_10075 [Bdellovibrionaceae bacterium]|nr:hypothetical protein [Pseudobdellovibrionaceae bacterium]|tara:strand:+ start:2727 stop:4487 length:1761 start_codon:yes stop_codon:yes gene_type:complete
MKFFEKSLGFSRLTIFIWVAFWSLSAFSGPPKQEVSSFDGQALLAQLNQDQGLSTKEMKRVHQSVIRKYGRDALALADQTAKAVLVEKLGRYFAGFEIAQNKAIEIYETIRGEVQEDLGEENLEEIEKRFKERVNLDQVTVDLSSHPGFHKHWRAKVTLISGVPVIQVGDADQNHDALFYDQLQLKPDNPKLARYLKRQTFLRNRVVYLIPFAKGKLVDQVPTAYQHADVLIEQLEVTGKKPKFYQRGYLKAGWDSYYQKTNSAKVMLGAYSAAAQIGGLALLEGLKVYNGTNGSFDTDKFLMQSTLTAGFAMAIGAYSDMWRNFVSEGGPLKRIGKMSLKSGLFMYTFMVMEKGVTSIFGLHDLHGELQSQYEFIFNQAFIWLNIFTANAVKDRVYSIIRYLNEIKAIPDYEIPIPWTKKKISTGRLKAIDVLFTSIYLLPYMIKTADAVSMGPNVDVYGQSINLFSKGVLLLSLPTMALFSWTAAKAIQGSLEKRIKGQPGSERIIVKGQKYINHMKKNVYRSLLTLTGTWPVIYAGSLIIPVVQSKIMRSMDSWWGRGLTFLTHKLKKTTQSCAAFFKYLLED